MSTIYGFLERITYHNEENDFVVAKLQEKGKRSYHQDIGQDDDETKNLGSTDPSGLFAHSPNI